MKVSEEDEVAHVIDSSQNINNIIVSIVHRIITHIECSMIPSVIWEEMADLIRALIILIALMERKAIDLIMADLIALLPIIEALLQYQRELFQIMNTLITINLRNLIVVIVLEMLDHLILYQRDTLVIFYLDVVLESFLIVAAAVTQLAIFHEATPTFQTDQSAIFREEMVLEISLITPQINFLAVAEAENVVFSFIERIQLCDPCLVVYYIHIIKRDI
jgi:uncharacterized membrane protein YedE/YeeE